MRDGARKAAALLLARRGVLHTERGQLAEAGDDFEQATVLLRAAECVPGAAITRYAQGLVAALTPRTREGAVVAFSHAATLANAAFNPSLEIRARRRAADLALASGDFARAQHECSQLIRLHDFRHDAPALLTDLQRRADVRGAAGDAAGEAEDLKLAMAVASEVDDLGAAASIRARLPTP